MACPNYSSVGPAERAALGPSGRIQTVLQKVNIKFMGISLAKLAELC